MEVYKEKKIWDVVCKWSKRALYVFAVLGAALAEHWIGILKIIKSKTQADFEPLFYPNLKLVIFITEKNRREKRRA